MNKIHGTYRDGHVELNANVDWPDGLHVTIQPHLHNDEPPGTKLPAIRLPDGSELAWSDTAEFRDALISQMDRRDPVELTQQEEANWQAARQWFRNHTVQAVRAEMGLEP